MDLIVLITLAAGLVVVLSLIFLLRQRSSKEGENEAPQQARAQEGQRPRRAVVARNQRARLRGAAPQHRDDSDEENDEPKADIDIPDKVGAKKRAKLEAKAERKAQREAELQAREDRKKRQEQEEEERLKSEELAKKEKEKQLEEEQKAREEKERQEYEEYLKMKAAFSIEEEGYEEGNNEDSEGNLLQEFISYIKSMKVVVLEDLAVTFKLKTQNVIDRIQELQSEGTLTGVVDDRGKFIYISEEELTSVAKFVKQRGRVSIVDLAESSNQLINLNPNQAAVEVKT